MYGLQTQSGTLGPFESVELIGDKWTTPNLVLPISVVGEGAAVVDWVPIAAAPAQAYVPNSVTIRQARLAFLQVGLLDGIDASIANGSDRALQIEWEFATEFRRDWPALLAIQQVLSLTDEQVDNLFTLAATL